MDRHSITLRAAIPTLEDGLAAARYVDAAAEGFMRLMFGRRFADITAKAFIEPDHDLSYQNATFAERGDVIVGMALAYTAEQHRLSSRQPLERAAGKLRLRMRILLILFSPLMRLNDSIADGDFYLHAIAVDPALRVDGVGSTLMNAYEEQARASGSTRLALDVSTNNDVARRFYERRGWNVESEWPKVWFMPSLSVRMTKPL